MDDLINNKLESFNDKNISNVIMLESDNAYLFIHKCKNKCMYMKYINRNLDFEYILDASHKLYIYLWISTLKFFI